MQIRGALRPSAIQRFRGIKKSPLRHLPGRGWSCPLLRHKRFQLAVHFRHIIVNSRGQLLSSAPRGRPAEQKSIKKGRDETENPSSSSFLI